MAGIEIIEDMSEHQVEAQAGSETLKTESSPLSQIHQSVVSSGTSAGSSHHSASALLGLQRTLKRSANKLRDTLTSNQLVIPLFVRLTLQRSFILFQSTQFEHLKLIGDFYDKCQETLIQYIEFLNIYLDKKTYAELMPSLNTLVQTYKLEPEASFALIRPVIHLLYVTVSFASYVSMVNCELVNHRMTFLQSRNPIRLIMRMEGTLQWMLKSIMKKDAWSLA